MPGYLPGYRGLELGSGDIESLAIVEELHAHGAFSGLEVLYDFHRREDKESWWECERELGRSEGRGRLVLQLGSPGRAHAC